MCSNESAEGEKTPQQSFNVKIIVRSDRPAEVVKSDSRSSGPTAAVVESKRSTQDEMWTVC